MTSGTVKIHVRKPRRRRRCLTVRNALTVASHFNIIWRESGCSLLCSGYLYLIPFCLIPVPSSNALGSHGNSDEKWLSHQIATGKYKRCPKCRVAVSKSEGCNAITCRCGIVFCWKCGHDVDPNGCDCLKTLPKLGLDDRRDALRHDVLQVSCARLRISERPFALVYTKLMSTARAGEFAFSQSRPHGSHTVS